MANLKLFIIDEHQDVREALRARLSSTPGFEVEAVGSFAEGLRGVDEGKPDVVLMELKGKDHAGLQAMRQLASKTRVVVLTSYTDEEEREAALRAGAWRYWLKDIDSTRLIEGIRAVAAEPWQRGGEASRADSQSMDTG
ncbi:MAG: response regulator transcription factor [Chloroflexi bacterium]|nr:response regulator transcription factor [Chloroflexota bacterium]